VTRHRPSWEEFASVLAEAASTRSEDPWVQVGAAVLRPDRSVAGVGYNGAPSGVEIDWSDRDGRRPFVIHAEDNALRYCHPGDVWLVAVTLSPCVDCLKVIKAYKAQKVVFREWYTTDPKCVSDTQRMAKLYKLDLVHMPAKTA
jgi:dCMP deaminase